MAVPTKRRFRVNVAPRYDEKVRAYALDTGQSQSAAISSMVKQFFDTMDPEKISKIIRNYTFIQSNQ